MIKNIIFDMDGVLLKSHESHNHAWKKAFDKFKIESSFREMNLIEGATSDEFIHYFLKKSHHKSTKILRQKILKKKREIFYSEFDHKPYRIKTYLTNLKDAGVKMAINTGASRKLAQELSHSFFKNIFEVIISGDDVKHGKPNPEGYIHAAKMLNAKKKETIIIENAPYGIEAGISAKIPVFALKTTLPQKDLSHATKIFKNHKELFEYIFSHLS